MRLNDVIAATASAIDFLRPGPIRLLSLCAGDARDIANVLLDHPRRADVTGCAVELDPTLASHATGNLAATEGRVTVRCADASDPISWEEFLPADLLLLVGIFGNISDSDIERTIKAVPTICRPGASIVWTRHRRAPDMTPSIRSWFDDVGCARQSFRSPGPNGYAVGTENYVQARTPSSLPHHLFSFVERSS
jgi:hypothetical protein